MVNVSFSSSMPLPSLRLRVSSMIFVAVLAGAGFLFSALGEQHFKGGPLSDQSTVEFVVDGEVEMLSAVTDDSDVDPDVDTDTDAAWSPLDADFVLTAGMAFRTSEDSQLGIFLKGTDLVRLFPDTEIEILETDLTSTPLRLDVFLVSGTLWISDLEGVADLTVHTPFSRIEPEEASAAVTYDGATTNVFAAKHPVRFSFLSTEQTLLNSYLLTESHELSLKESTFTPTLAELRTTKLVKDYPFEYVDVEAWNPRWVTALEGDMDRLRQTYQNFISFLRRQGSGGYENGSWMEYFSNFYTTVRYGLVFDDGTLQALKEEEGLDLLYQALYLISDDNSMEALDRLERFEALAGTFENLEGLESLYPVFQSVNVNNDFYPVKELLWDVRVQAAPESERLLFSLSFLRQRLNEVYDLLDEGDFVEAKQALLDYNQEWQTVMETYGAALVDVVPFLTEERQILQNLLYRESIFYDVNSYAVLSALEDRILNLIGEEYDLNEERTLFVKDKLAVLGQLVDFIDEGKVSLDTGTDLAHQLIDESQTLIQDVTIQVAVVTDFFIPELSELTLKFQFLNSPDYLLGEGTLDQKFKAYLLKQDDLQELTEYLAGLRSPDSEGESSTTLDEALTEVKADLEEVGVSYLALLPLGDADYRLFEIEGGRLLSIEFTANYDRGTQIVYDLQVEGETFSSGVKLENLLDALQQASAENTVDDTTDVDTETSSSSEAELSPVEAVAISLLRRTLESESDLSFEDAEISIVDLESNLFSVDFSFTDSGETFEVTFSYAGDEDLVFDTTVSTPDYVFALEDTEPATLKEKVLEGWQQARGF